ncbi:pupal cuticle protein G1A [Drosophila virilis]|uniref:Uncharacterized protein n=1 Tax=Drosophila virilis TaxID=7244 RepID=B4LZK7_DROVI|nr:larval/pupal cuticle protein H1C [Drosophila virilis]EDW67146.1 uncharacterized protein Dvir_GJ23249 [Drosophila virilis]
MKFLICLALCIATAQAGILAAPVASYAAVAPVATYSAVTPVRYSTYAAVAPIYRTPVTTYAAAPVYTAPITGYAAAAVASPFWKK